MDLANLVKKAYNANNVTTKRSKMYLSMKIAMETNWTSQSYLALPHLAFADHAVAKKSSINKFSKVLYIVNCEK